MRFSVGAMRRISTVDERHEERRARRGEMPGLERAQSRPHDDQDAGEADDHRDDADPGDALAQDHERHAAMTRNGAVKISA